MGESFNPLLLLLLYLWDAKNEFCSAMLSIVPIVAKAVELQCKRKIWLSWGWYNYNCTSGFQWCVVAEEHDVALGQMWWDWPPFCHACFVRLVLCQHFECHSVETYTKKIGMRQTNTTKGTQMRHLGELGQMSLFEHLRRLRQKHKFMLRCGTNETIGTTKTNSVPFGFNPDSYWDIWDR